jgi:hypothetical protein
VTDKMTPEERTSRQIGLAFEDRVQELEKQIRKNQQLIEWLERVRTQDPQRENIDVATHIKKLRDQIIEARQELVVMRLGREYYLK